MQLKDPGTLLQVAQEEHGEVRHSSISALYHKNAIDGNMQNQL